MINLDTSPRQYFPSVYDKVVEIDELAKAEDCIFKEALNHLDNLWKNSFVATCNAEGITHYEKVLGIVLNPAEADGFTEEAYLNFRRDRVLNRFATIPVFTMPWLRARLDTLFGIRHKDYELYINRTDDGSVKELVVETTEKSTAWLHEVSVTINHIKPANLVFISRPSQAFNVLVTETVSKRVRTNNYKLGSWKLGNLPFSQFSDEEVAKMADTPSIQARLLNKLATFTADDVQSVLINGTHKISTFINKSSEGGNVSIEYEVYASLGLGEITSVQLLDAANQPLADITVSIDNTFNVRMRHKIHFEEGINAETT